MDLQLEKVHISKATASFKFLRLDQPVFNGNWHYHPELELTYIEKGEGIRFTGDHIGSFSDGDLVLVGEQLPHNWVSDQDYSGGNSIAYVFQFEKNLFQAFPECKPLTDLFRQSSRGIRFPNPNMEVLKTIRAFDSFSPTERFISFLKILNDLNEEKNKEMLSGITYNQVPLEASQNKISRVANYILKRLDRPLSLDQVADFSQMTNTSFCRWFKQATGNSFVHYLNAARIERACFKLLHSDKRISEIAYDSGFETAGHFNRTFKKLKNTSPSQYRKRYL